MKVYEQESATGMTGKDLPKKDLFVNITASGWHTIDLSDYNIRLDGPFFVSFQWIDAHTMNPAINLNGLSGDEGSFTKPVSFGKWLNGGSFNWVNKAKVTL